MILTAEISDYHHYTFCFLHVLVSFIVCISVIVVINSKGTCIKVNVWKSTLNHS